MTLTTISICNYGFIFETTFDRWPHILDVDTGRTA